MGQHGILNNKMAATAEASSEPDGPFPPPPHGMARDERSFQRDGREHAAEERAQKDGVQGAYRVCITGTDQHITSRPAALPREKGKFPVFPSGRVEPSMSILGGKRKTRLSGSRGRSAGREANHLAAQVRARRPKKGRTGQFPGMGFR